MSGSEEGEVDVEIQDEAVDEEIMENSEEEDQERNEEETEHIPIQPLVIDNIEDDHKNATFTFYNEDHTLGNVLRSTLIKNKHVEFWGYTIPHPSEPYLKLRVQSHTKDAKAILKSGLKRIDQECEIVNTKFEEALKRFKDQQMND